MGKFLFFGVCLDSNDPKRAGRIRAVLDEDRGDSQTPQDYDALMLKGLLTEEKYSMYTTVEQLKWSKDDPHLYTPFLPYFINVVPKEAEDVTLMFFDSLNNTQNKLYMGPRVSSPEKLPFEKFNTARQGTSKGTRVKEGLNVTDSDISQNVFSEPTKISIDGRSNADIVFSGTENEDGEIVLRTGKLKKNKNRPEFPIFNDKPTFIQYSNYPSKLTLKQNKTNYEKPVEAIIRYLVEYDVFALDSPDSLNGNIKLYELKVKSGFKQMTNLDSPGLSTNFQTQNDLKVRAELNFTNQSISGTTYLINEFLEEVGTFNDKTLTDPPFNEGVLSGLTSGAFEKRGEYIDDFSSLSSGQDQNLNLFPFYYRPTKGFMEIVNSQDVATSLITNNANKVVENIGLTGVNNKKYYGFVLSKENPEPTTNTLTTTIINRKYEDERQGIVAQLSNKILFYSYDSVLPNRVNTNPITENLNNNEVGDNLGLAQENLVKLNDFGTEPIVRGEQLTELLTKIVLFLKTHVHGEGNTTQQGTQDGGTQLLDEIEDILTKGNYLNKNIRIN